MGSMLVKLTLVRMFFFSRSERDLHRSRIVFRDVIRPTCLSATGSDTPACFDSAEVTNLQAGSNPAVRELHAPG